MAIRSLSAPDAQKNQTVSSQVASPRGAARLRVAARLASWGCLAAALSSSGGCSILTTAQKAVMRHDCLDEFMVDYRNKSMAAKAWHCAKPRFCHRGHLDEFQAGFYAGYCAIADGGSGCVPAIAPKEYWGWKYQSADGQAAVNSWFEGYPMGVQAAEQDGIGHWSQIRPAGLPTVVPGSADGVPTEVQGPIYMEGPAIEVIPSPYGPSGMEMMLETGPQILMNEPGVAYPHRHDMTSASDTSGASASIARTAGTSGSEATSTTLEPAKPSTGDSAESVDAIFGSSSGANASLGDASGDELPFSFK